MIARRAELGKKSAMDIENETGGVIYEKLLYRIENGQKDPRTLRQSKFAKLLEALRWSTLDFERATGLMLEPMPGLLTDQLPTSVSVPTYRLIQTPGKPGGVMRTGIVTFIDEDWEGEFEAYVINDDGSERTTAIIKLGEIPRPKDTVLLRTKERGVFLARVVTIDSDSYFLDGKEGPFVEKSPEVLGVRWRVQTDRI